MYEFATLDFGFTPVLIKSKRLKDLKNSMSNRIMNQLKDPSITNTWAMAAQIRLQQGQMAVNH